MTNNNIGTVNVTNGIASIELNTNNLEEGNYNIIAQYNENEHYKTTTATANLTIQPDTQTIIYDNDTLTTTNGSYYNTRWLYQGTGTTAQQVYSESDYYYAKAIRDNYKWVYFNYPLPKQSDTTIDCKFYTSSNSGSVEWGLIGLDDIITYRGVAREFVYAHESTPSWEHGEWQQNRYIRNSSIKFARNTWHDVTFHIDYGKVSVTYGGNTYGPYVLDVNGNDDIYIGFRTWGSTNTYLGDVTITTEN